MRDGQIVDQADDTHESARTNAARALAKVAEQYPGDAQASVDALTALLDDTHESARVNAAFALGVVAQEYPKRVGRSVASLITLLDDPNDRVR